MKLVYLVMVKRLQIYSIILQAQQNIVKGWHFSGDKTTETFFELKVSSLIF